MKYILIALLFISCTKTVTVEKLVEKEVEVLKIVEKEVPKIQYIRIESVDIDDSTSTSTTLNVN